MDAMEDSVIENLQSEGPGIKRKAKRIQYKKPKARFAVKSSGILNRSVYKLNASKSFNDSKGGRSQSQKVSIQNINAFLTKNKELAKALEESRQQSKNLEKDKFTYQVECLEMKEKINFLQNAALKCSCISNNKLLTSPNIDLLFDLKENIKNSVFFIEKYIDQASTSRIEFEKELEIAKPVIATQTHEIGIQANFPPVKPVKKQMRNKKLQVDLSSKISLFNNNNSSNSNRSLEKNPSTTDKLPPSKRNIAVQSIPTTFNSVGVQCSSTTTASTDVGEGVKSELLLVNSKKTTTPRKPLAVINANIGGGNTLGKNKTNCKMVKPNTKSPFKIYADTSTGSEKENTPHHNQLKSKKSVRISHQPAKVHYFEVVSPHYDHRLRPRNANTNYKETLRNTRVDYEEIEAQQQQHQQQLKVRKKKRRPKKRKPYNPTMSIEDIISLVEESFMAGQCSARDSILVV